MNFSQAIQEQGMATLSNALLKIQSQQSRIHDKADNIDIPSITDFYFFDGLEGQCKI